MLVNITQKTPCRIRTRNLAFYPQIFSYQYGRQMLSVKYSDTLILKTQPFPKGYKFI